MRKKKHSLISKKIDILFLILSPIFAALVSLFFKTNFFTSTLLYFGIPAVYLSLRNKHTVKKSIIFSLISIVIIGPFMDYIAISSGAWYVPKTVFPIRLFNVVPLEDLIWGFLLIYDIIMFYEHLLDKGKHNLKDTNLKYFIVVVIFIGIALTLIYLLKKDIIIGYSYLKMGIAIVLLPTISFLSFFPRLLSKFVKTGVYFFVVGIMVELTGVSLNQWGFRGNNFIGWISVGTIRFPLEEFFFYIVLFSTCVLSYYEFFDDDRK